MHRIGKEYPYCGYGGKFFDWMFGNHPKPYGSCGNGSAMRVSYIGEYYDDLQTAVKEAEKSALPSHDHPEGIKGAVGYGFHGADIYDIIDGDSADHDSICYMTAHIIRNMNNCFNGGCVFV